MEPYYIHNDQKYDGFSLRVVEYFSDALIPLHRHDNARMIVILKGGLHESYENRSVECLTSGLLLRPRSLIHSNLSSREGAFTASVDLEADWIKRLNLNGSIWEAPSLIHTPQIAVLGIRMQKELGWKDSVAQLAMEALILELAVQTVRGKQRKDDASWLRRARDFLHAEFRTSLSLSDIARAVGVHPVSLAKQFRKHFGCTVAEYIRALRIQYACMQLESDENTIARIAQEAGFCDQSHFTRTFRTQTGMTPGEYRVHSRKN